MWRCLVCLLAVILALGVLAACDEGSDDAADDQTTEMEAEAGDTGRMSEGEFDTASSTVDDLNGEMRDYRNKLADRCSVLLRGFEVAATLECVDEAYDGVEGQFGLTYDELSALQADTAKRCLRALKVATNIVNRPYYRAAQVSKEVVDALEPTLVGPALDRLNQQEARWTRAAANMLALCEPE